jgi:cytochrome c oxidase subunit 3
VSDSHASAVDTEVPSPELRHHFADMQQQKDAASLGMWLFLVTEIMFFGGMFCVYLVYRLNHFNAFAAASQSLDIRLGAFNTAVLLVSSLTVVLAVRAAQDGNRKQLVAYLVITVLLGLTFLGVKAVEYHEKFEMHNGTNHVPGAAFGFTNTFDDNGKQIPVDPREAQLFFSLYFAMTGMHALHMIIGCGLFSVLTVLAWKGRYSPAYYTPIENAGLYWHLVDIIWIYLFPLLYLISRHS